MKRLLSLAWLCAIGMLPLPQIALAGQAEYDALVAKHAKANAVPAALVHRVIVRESRYHPDLVGRGGTIGLMQIKLATARGLGYTGDAEGLRDPETNLTYGVKYLAGAWRAANGDHDRAMHYFASGYYFAAKQQRLERERLKQAGILLARAPAKEAAKPEEVAPALESAKPAEDVKPEEAVAKPEETAKPNEVVATPAENATPNETAATPKENATPKRAAAKPKAAHKKLADAGLRVPRPPAGIPGGANAAKPR
jgi:ribosomal 50S subunit-recycling heat shock protein